MIYDCIIIGAGPAGLMAAASFETENVLILESGGEPGRKLLLSGNGQCNFTHDGMIQDFFDRFGAKKRFVRKALSKFTNTDAIYFFERYGVAAVHREDGKVFPKSLKAGDILSLLLNRAEALNISIAYQSKVKKIVHENGLYSMETEKSVYKSKSIILATGGASYPMTGSDGSGYKLAEMLGHTIVSPHAGLAPVYIKDFSLKALAGITYPNGHMTHWRSGKKIGDYHGDILITHTGLSGPCILDNSRYMVKDDELAMQLFYNDSSESDVEKSLIDGQKKQVKTILTQFMPSRMAVWLLEYLRVSPEKVCAELSKKDRKSIVLHGAGFKMKIDKIGQLASAMATAGGVSIKEIQAGQMSSKICPGLFFAGEVMDVDGDSGGYNIQWAFSSGVLAAKSAIRYLKETNGGGNVGQ